MELASVPRSRATRFRSAGLRTAIGLAVAVILVLTFLRLVNVAAVDQRLTHLSISYALLCGAAFLGAYVIRALRWRWLLQPCQVSIPRVIAIYQVATFINWLLPVRGGELVKCLLLRHSNGIPVSRSLATVSMDKALDLLPAAVLVVLLPVSGLRLSSPLWVLLIAALAVVTFAAGILALAAWRRERAQVLITRSLATVLPGRARERIEPAVVQFVDTLLQLIRRPHLMLIATAYTAVAVSMDALSCWFAFKAVGLAVPVTIVLYGYTLFNLAFILPTPPGQVGSNELIGLLIFSGLFGVSRSGVGAMFLFAQPGTAILMTASGLACLAGMGLSLRGTLRLARDQGDRNAQEQEEEDSRMALEPEEVKGA
jgi:uncharacterized protein (TIRG00374 family)